MKIIFQQDFIFIYITVFNFFKTCIIKIIEFENSIKVSNILKFKYNEFLNIKDYFII